MSANTKLTRLVAAVEALQFRDNGDGTATVISSLESYREAVEALALAKEPEPEKPLLTARAFVDVLAERMRQIHKEGWTAEHDDENHSEGELAVAAACYALGEGYVHISRQINSSRGAGDCYQYDFTQPGPEEITWPWDEEWWKPKDLRRNLVRAAALLLAEIERLDRAAAREVQGEAG